MPGPLSAETLKQYADPAYLSKSAPAKPDGPNWMHRIGLPAIAGGTAADLGTTLAALKRGGKEANPLYGEHPGAGRLVATSVATTLPAALLLDRLYDKSAPGSNARKIALLIALGIGGATAGVAAHNTTVAKK
jgi:hypothetical protein